MPTISFKPAASHHHEALKSVQDGVAQAAGPEAAGHSHEGGMEMHSWIGAALVIGFVFMLLVDQLGGASHHHPVTGEWTSGFLYIILRVQW